MNSNIEKENSMEAKGVHEVQTKSINENILTDKSNDSQFPRMPFSASDHEESWDGYSDIIIETLAAFLNSRGGEIHIVSSLEISPIFDILKEDLSSLYPENLWDEFVLFDNGSKVITIKKGLIPFFVVKGTNYNYYCRHFTENECKIYTIEDANSLINSEIGIKPIVNGDKYFAAIYQRVGYFTLPDKLFKYMSLEAAMYCIRDKSIRFSEPSTWSDQREKVFYNLPFKKMKQSVDNPPLVACCFTNKEHNEAAWKIYSYEKKGLDSRCVEFTIDTKMLLRQILAHLNSKLDNYKLYNGIITYKNDVFFNILSKKDTYLFNEYFNKFSLDKYMSLLLLKHNVFEHEQECRFFLVPDIEKMIKLTKGNLPYIYIPINWAKVLTEVKIDSNCTDLEKTLFKEELFSKGNNGAEIDGELRDKLEPKDYNPHDNSIPIPDVE